MLNIFKPIKTTNEKLVTISKKAGQLIFVTDKKRLYIDISSADTGRIMVSADSFIDVSCNDGKTLTFVKADGSSMSASIAVDNSLLANSTNAVQNKVVKAKIDEVLTLISNNTTAINTRVDSTNTDLATEKTKIAKALADILVLQTDVSDLKEKDKELKQNYSNLDKKVTQNQTDIQINKDAILALQQADTKLNAKDTALEKTITQVRGEVETEVQRAKDAESALSSRITANGQLLAQHTSALDTIQGTGEGSISQIAASKVAEIVDNAPEDFDTLRELAAWLNAHGSTAAEMQATISTNTQNISKNASAIDSEEERALTAEGALENSIADIASDLGAEISRAKAAEKVNSDNISNLKNSRIRDVALSGRTLTITKPDGSTKSYTTQDTTYGLATTNQSGLMSASDKTKIAGIPQIVFCTQAQYNALGSATATDGKIYFIKG